MNHALFGALIILLTAVNGQQTSQNKPEPKPANDAQRWPTAMQEIYTDESHCLTSADMRGDKDNPISCYCRDAIENARYVYFTYFLTHKDNNLTGIFLALQDYARDTCSRDTAERLDMAFISEMQHATTLKDWKWNGPEVVRTFPPDDVIERIKPSGEHGSGRWVPYTVQLVYRDAQGRVARTENYSSREFDPVFPRVPQSVPADKKN